MTEEYAIIDNKTKTSIDSFDSFEEAEEVQIVVYDETKTSIEHREHTSFGYTIKNTY